MSELEIRAGAVVYQRSATGVRFLLVSAKSSPELWIVPQGHHEAGETMAETARREALEEAGAEVVVEHALSAQTRAFQGRTTYTEFFLARLVTLRSATEGRALCWATWEELPNLNLLPETRALLTQAYQRLTKP